MTNNNQYMNIPAEKFRFAKRTDLSHDKKFDTKPVSYFEGAFRRFCKNKGAIVGAIVSFQFSPKSSAYTSGWILNTTASLTPSP